MQFGVEIVLTLQKNRADRTLLWFERRPKLDAGFGINCNHHDT